MKSFFNVLFIVLGVLFLIENIIILTMVLVFIFDPFNLRPILSMIDISKISSEDSNSSQDSYDHPLLSDEQENTLKSFGIDPTQLPTSITPEMEKCFIEELGASRVEQIMQSGSPTVNDFFQARSCL